MLSTASSALFQVVLVHPEIPPNTGNIIRLCANIGADLHLIKPLGFELDDRRLRRAGLDYHEYASVKTHHSWQDFLHSLSIPLVPEGPGFASEDSGMQSKAQNVDGSLTPSRLCNAAMRPQDRSQDSIFGYEGYMYEGYLPQRSFALTTKGSSSLYEHQFMRGDIFVFGSETAGLPPDIREQFPASQRLRIPMQANQRSLNLSNAAAVTLYEAWRQIQFMPTYPT